MANEASSSSIDLQLTYYDRNYNSAQNNRAQSALSATLAHKQSLANGRFELGGAFYAVQKIANSGRVIEDVLTISEGELSGFALIGEAHARFRPSERLSVLIGRFKHKSLLLKSKTRAATSTFEGLGFDYSPSEDANFYAHRFYRWSARASDEFSGFDTNTSNNSAIPYLTIIGAKLTNFSSKAWPVKSNIEYLESKNYLRKFGIASSIEHILLTGNTIRLSSGLFFSRDAGNLFANGANDALDYLTSSSTDRQQHRGFGGYIAFHYSQGNSTFGVTHSFFGDPWLEDSFADDHGTTPFPTKTYGPELSNKNERIWKLEYSHRHEHGWAQGLQNRLSWARGTGAQNSINAELGSGSESWLELDLRYSPKFFKKLEARMRYRIYQSELVGQIAGIKDDRSELRLTINYSSDF
jgi:hypothetical protein